LQLHIPEPALVLLIGPSGSGKSTFANAHFTANEVISSDALRAMLADDPADQEASAEAFRILSLLANGRLKRRLTTVIDATNLRAANRKNFTQLASRYGIRTVAIAFDLPVELYNENNSRRPDRVVKTDVVADQVERMRETMPELLDENFGAVYVFRSLDEVNSAGLTRSKSSG
jgi:protein phosphatase